MFESVRYFNIDSKDLAFLKFVLEAYEGLATMSTEDAKAGIIRISTPICQEPELDKVLQALKADLSFREIASSSTLAAANLSSPPEHCHA